MTTLLGGWRAWRAGTRHGKAVLAGHEALQGGARWEIEHSLLFFFVFSC
jgi:hypothetical protein